MDSVSIGNDRDMYAATVCVDVCRETDVDMCKDMRVDMRADMCMDVCVDMRVDMCAWT